MNVLLIEDLDSKATAVTNCLSYACGNDQIDLDRVRSFTGALQLLRCKHYDLLLLDLVFPVCDNAQPVQNAGTDLLKELVDGDLMRPTHIICLTEYAHLSCSLSGPILKSLTHIIQYTDATNQWQEALIAKCKYVCSRLIAAATIPLTYSTDVAIVTSSPSVELREVLALDDGFKAEFNSADALHYHMTTWRDALGRDRRVVACAAPQMGMTAAAVTTAKVIERWRPQFVAMCGIAAGTNGSLNFGDILVPEMVYDYGSGKIVQTRTGKRRFIPDPRPFSIDVEVKALLQKIAREQAFVGNFMKEWRGASLSWTPAIHLGVLASGAAVVQSKSLVAEIKNMSRKTVGLEMEAYGVFHACALARSPRPRVLVAKAVSDFADSTKSDKWQQLAAFTSARFLKAFFTDVREINW